jgi:hypothetical protein
LQSGASLRATLYQKHLLLLARLIIKEQPTINLVTDLKCVQRITERGISSMRFEHTLIKPIADIEKGLIRFVEEVKA